MSRAQRQRPARRRGRARPGGWAGRAGGAPRRHAGRVCLHPFQALVPRLLRLSVAAFARRALLTGGARPGGALGGALHHGRRGQG